MEKLIGIKIKRNSNNEILISYDLNDIGSPSDFYAKKTKELKKTFEKHIEKMKKAKNRLQVVKEEKKPILARDMWKLGDLIIKMVEDFQNRGFLIEELYETLSGELGFSRSSLEKIVSLRKSVDSLKTIPVNLKWSQVRDAPKKYFKENRTRNNRSS